MRARTLILLLPLLGLVGWLLCENPAKDWRTFAESPEKQAAHPESQGAELRETPPAEATADRIQPAGSPAQESAANPTSASPPDPATWAPRLAGHCDAALTGELDINAVLRLMIEASEQPLSPFADMDESDEDGLVYPLTGLPEGLQGHLRFGNPEVFDGEFRLRTAYIVLEGKDLEPEFVQGALRRPASASFSCAWSDGDPGHARWSDLALQRSPDLAASKRTGINAHEGTWTTGLSWRQDLRGDGSGLQTSPTGMVQGNPSNDPAAFGGAPIRGQLEPDPALVQQLFERLLEQRRRAQGQ